MSEVRSSMVIIAAFSALIGASVTGLRTLMADECDWHCIGREMLSGETVSRLLREPPPVAAVISCTNVADNGGLVE